MTDIRKRRPSLAEGVRSGASANAVRPSLAATSRFRLLTPDELDDLPDPQWLIENVLPEGGLAMLYSEPGVGKSFLALDWANAIASGGDWFGRKVASIDVVYVYAEGATGLKWRESAWR